MSKLCPTYIAHMIGGPTRGENWTTKMANVDINNEIIQLNQCNYFKDSLKKILFIRFHDFRQRLDLVLE